jgi:hypothetical protein
MTVEYLSSPTPSNRDNRITGGRHSDGGFLAVVIAVTEVIGGEGYGEGYVWESCR